MSNTSTKTPTWQLAIVALVIFVIIIAILWVIANAMANWVIYGQEPDYKYSCMYFNQYPFHDLCVKQYKDAAREFINEVCDSYDHEDLCDYLTDPDH